VGQIDQPHHTEDQSQSGGHQEQHHSELQSVEYLFYEQKS
jgi:hypothetical protein